MDYCATVWSSGSSNVRQQATAAQKQAVRALYDYAKNQRSEDFMALHNIIPANLRWETQEAAWLFRVLNKEKFSLPNYIIEMVPVKETRTGLRNRYRIEAESSTKKGESTLAWRLMGIFKKFPHNHEIWKCTSLNSFRNRYVKSFL